MAGAAGTGQGAAGIGTALGTCQGQVPGVIAVMPEGERDVLPLDPLPRIALAAPEDVRSGAVPGLMMRRCKAGPAGDGRFVRDIGMAPDGTVMRNGIGMSMPADMKGGWA